LAEPPVGRDSHGVISPDGSTAAVLTSGPNGTLGLSVLNVARGSWLAVPGLVTAQGNIDGSIAFSPDSKWLFAVTAGGSIAAINPRTSTASILDVPLPPLTQLAVRPAARAPAPRARLTPREVAAALTPTCCRPTPEE
jgi:hypothetical protein